MVIYLVLRGNGLPARQQLADKVLYVSPIQADVCSLEVVIFQEEARPLRLEQAVFFGLDLDSDVRVAATARAALL